MAPTGAEPAYPSLHAFLGDGSPHVHEAGQWEGARARGGVAMSPHVHEAGQWEGARALGGVPHVHEAGQWEGARARGGVAMSPHVHEAGQWEGARALGGVAMLGWVKLGYNSHDSASMCACAGKYLRV